jgi:hypothetical protein
MRGVLLVAAIFLVLPGCVSHLDAGLYNDDGERAHSGRVAIHFERDGKNQTLLDIAFNVTAHGSARWPGVWGAFKSSPGPGTLSVVLQLDNGTVVKAVQQDWQAGRNVNGFWVSLQPGHVEPSWSYAD